MQHIELFYDLQYEKKEEAQSYCIAINNTDIWPLWQGFA